MIQEPIVEIDDVQGNIVPGFKKDNQTFLFFRVTDGAAARSFLGRISGRVSSSRQVFLAHALWKDMRDRLGREPTDFQIVFLNVAISRVGLMAMRWDQGLDDFDDDGFLIGLEERAGLIGDPTEQGAPGSPSTWMFGSGANVPHIVLIMASDHADWLASEAETLIEHAEQSGLRLVQKDRGRVRPGDQAGHEVFGFKDGVSEPAIRGKYPDQDQFLVRREFPNTPEFTALQERFAGPGRNLVWPGQFLFGYPKQNKDDPLVPGATTKGPEWAKNGSFLVYRRLRQDKSAFDQFVQSTSVALAPLIDTATPDWVGSRLVGRWKDGTPIMRQPVQELSISGPGDNYFEFSTAITLPLPGDMAPLSGSDMAGAVCPLAAHIRKVNPRDDTTDLGDATRTFEKLILRRGIAYDNSAAVSGDEGLLFVAYQTSIVDQFEFLMNDWVGKEDKPRGGAGFDPILGASPGRYINFLVDQAPHRLDLPARFVYATGGEYFFAPSISCLNAIARHS